MSGIFLDGLERWDRLGEFLASGLAMTPGLQAHVPDELSELQRFLESDRPFDELFVVRDPPGPRAWVSTSKKRKAKPGRRA